MSVIIGSARVDERGTYSGGVGGDQKQGATPDYKGEVSMQDFYNHKKGWYVLIPKSAENGRKMAKNMEDACNNKNLGYSQSDRYGVIKYGTHTTQPTNCDCSSLVRSCIKEATGIDPGDFSTANEVSVLKRTGLFEDAKAYQSGMRIPTGSVLVTQTKGHTVLVVKGDDDTSTVVTGKTMYGIDVSHWQKGINLKKIQADFVLLKASQGTSFKDECLDDFAKQVQDSGKLLGVYHFADGKSSGKSEATWFLKCISPYIGNAVLILDWEADALKQPVSYALEFLRTVKKKAGGNPFIYFSENVATEKDWTSVAAEFPQLWGAKYGANPVRSGYKNHSGNAVKLGPFTEVMWQYSSRTHLTGWNGNLDANVFYGEKKDWLWLCNGTVTAQTVESVSNPTPVIDDAFKPYQVRINCDALNIWSGPGTKYKVVGVIKDHGIYTIVQEENGWGKLKSGAGWISLKYTRKP